MTKDEMVREAIDAIVGADQDKAAQVARDAIAAGMPPGEVMAEGFIAGITAVGELFESGELFLYEVTDAGRDVPAETFIVRAKEISADIIGMSALLTTTMEEQRKVIRIIKEQDLPFKTVVGGAPCTQRWADQIGADAYAEDANDGVKKIDELLGR